MTTKPAAAGPAAKAPGDIVRSIRKRLGLTLSEVGKRTGLAVSTLSKLEKGHVSLSYDKLLLLGKGLEVDITELLVSTPGGHRAQGSGRRVVHRAGEGRQVGTRSYSQLYLATELLQKRLTPLIVELHARTIEEFFAEFGDFIRHPGEEFSLVLEGEAEIRSELYAPLLLKTGDSIYFDSEMGHAYLKASNGPCRLVSACTSRSSDGQPMSAFVDASARHVALQAEPPTVATPKSPAVGKHSTLRRLATARDD